MSELIYRGKPMTPHEQAKQVRRWGVWYGITDFLIRAKAWRWSLLGYAIGQPLVYLLAMGVGLGSLVSAHGTTVEGVSYLVFVAPAVLISTTVMSVVGEVTYPVLASFKWERHYWATAATPMNPGQIALGHFFGILIRFFLQSTIFFLIMIAFSATTFTATSWLQVPVAVLTAAAFGAPMQAYAATVTGEGQSFTYLIRFVINPMYLFAGTYFPLEAMPQALQWIGWISPLWHGTVLARVASYGLQLPWWRIIGHVAFLTVLAIIGMVFAVRFYTRRLTS